MVPIARKRVESDQGQGQGDERDIQAHQAAGPGLGKLMLNFLTCFILLVEYMI